MAATEFGPFGQHRLFSSKPDSEASPPPETFAQSPSKLFTEGTANKVGVGGRIYFNSNGDRKDYTLVTTNARETEELGRVKISLLDNEDLSAPSVISRVEIDYQNGIIDSMRISPDGGLIEISHQETEGEPSRSIHITNAVAEGVQIPFGMEVDILPTTTVRDYSKLISTTVHALHSGIEYAGLGVARLSDFSRIPERFLTQTEELVTHP